MLSEVQEYFNHKKNIEEIQKERDFKSSQRENAYYKTTIVIMSSCVVASVLSMVTGVSSQYDNIATRINGITGASVTAATGTVVMVGDRVLTKLKTILENYKIKKIENKLTKKYNIQNEIEM